MYLVIGPHQQHFQDVHEFFKVTYIHNLRFLFYLHHNHYYVHTFTPQSTHTHVHTCGPALYARIYTQSNI